MRIGIDISQIAYANTGVANYTRELVKHLLKIAPKNEYVLFGSSLRRGHYLHEFHANGFNQQTKVLTRFYPLPLSVLEFVWNKCHVGCIEYFTGSLDVFHSSDWLEPPARASKVTTIHDLLVFKFPEFMHPKIVANQKQKLHWVKKETNLVIADSQSTKNDIIRYLNIDEAKIRVVYLGVEDIFTPKTETEVKSARQKYGIKKDYFLILGREPRKNVARIIQSFLSLGKKEVELVVAGSLVWGEETVPTANVRTIGQVDRFDLSALYSGAKALIYPSLYEGFGLPVLDALASGTRVVTSNRGSLKEIAGNAAIIVDPQDCGAIACAMDQVLSEPLADRQKNIIAGRSWAKRFTWEKTARQTLNVYQEAVSEK